MKPRMTEKACHDNPAFGDNYEELVDGGYTNIETPVSRGNCNYEELLDGSYTYIEAKKSGPERSDQQK